MRERVQNLGPIAPFSDVHATPMYTCARQASEHAGRSTYRRSDHVMRRRDKSLHCSRATRLYSCKSLHCHAKSSRGLTVQIAPCVTALWRRPC